MPPRPGKRAEAISQSDTISSPRARRNRTVAVKITEVAETTISADSSRKKRVKRTDIEAENKPKNSNEAVTEEGTSQVSITAVRNNGTEKGKSGGATSTVVEATATPVKRKRKTKEEKEQEAMPLAARTSGLRMFIGAHVSGAGGMMSSTRSSK